MAGDHSAGTTPAGSPADDHLGAWLHHGGIRQRGVDADGSGLSHEPFPQRPDRRHGRPCLASTDISPSSCLLKSCSPSSPACPHSLIAGPLCQHVRPARLGDQGGAAAGVEHPSLTWRAQEYSILILPITAIKGAVVGLQWSTSVDLMQSSVDQSLTTMAQTLLGWFYYTIGGGVGFIFWSACYQHLGASDTYWSECCCLSCLRLGLSASCPLLSPASASCLHLPPPPLQSPSTCPPSAVVQGMAGSLPLLGSATCSPCAHGSERGKRSGRPSTSGRASAGEGAAGGAAGGDVYEDSALFSPRLWVKSCCQGG
eukprot:745770-Hanusia_phi.AAC.1